jgi:hypothetical protein
LLDDRRIRIREAQNDTDPDPQHWIKVALFTNYYATRYVRKDDLVSDPSPEPGLGKIIPDTTRPNSCGSNRIRTNVSEFGAFE